MISIAQQIPPPSSPDPSLYEQLKDWSEITFRPLTIMVYYWHSIFFLAGTIILLIAVTMSLVRKKFHRTLMIISLILLAFWLWSFFIEPPTPYPYMPTVD
jgi:hypothetical protein